MWWTFRVYKKGVKPDFRQYEGNDPVGFVVSLNLHRRHLNESQRGMVATNIARLKNGSNQYLPKEGAQICAPNIPSQDEAAQMLNVSRRTVQHARAVQDEGAPELIEQVVSGKVAVSTASEVATLPKEEQAEIVASRSFGRSTREECRGGQYRRVASSGMLSHLCKTTHGLQLSF